MSVTISTPSDPIDSVQFRIYIGQLISLVTIVCFIISGRNARNDIGFPNVICGVLSAGLEQSIRDSTQETLLLL